MLLLWLFSKTIETFGVRNAWIISYESRNFTWLVYKCDALVVFRFCHYILYFFLFLVLLWKLNFCLALSLLKQFKLTFCCWNIFGFFSLSLSVSRPRHISMFAFKQTVGHLYWTQRCVIRCRFSYSFASASASFFFVIFDCFLFGRATKTSKTNKQIKNK